jgi:hypothetical protein
MSLLSNKNFIDQIYLILFSSKPKNDVISNYNFDNKYININYRNNFLDMTNDIDNHTLFYNENIDSILDDNLFTELDLLKDCTKFDQNNLEKFKNDFIKKNTYYNKSIHFDNNLLLNKCIKICLLTTEYIDCILLFINTYKLQTECIKYIDIITNNLFTNINNINKFTQENVIFLINFKNKNSYVLLQSKIYKLFYLYCHIQTNELINNYISSIINKNPILFTYPILFAYTMFINKNNITTYININEYINTNYKENLFYI